MDKYVNATKAALHHLLGNPHGALEFWAILVIASLVGVFVLYKSLDTMGSHSVSFAGAFIPGVQGMALMLVGGALATIYLKGTLGYTALLAVGMLLASIVLVIPLLNAILKCGFIGLFGSWLFAFGAFVIVVFAMNGVFDFVDSSGDVAGKQSERKAKWQRPR